MQYKKYNTLNLTKDLSEQDYKQSNRRATRKRKKQTWQQNKEKFRSIKISQQNYGHKFINL